jgi:hypothetical protein
VGVRENAWRALAALGPLDSSQALTAYRAYADEREAYGEANQ